MNNFNKTEHKDLYLPACSHSFRAILDLPGSKSIANRVLLLAGLADGDSLIYNVPRVAEDVTLMIRALQQLGVAFERINNANANDNIDNNNIGDDNNINKNINVNINNAYADAYAYRITGCCGEFPVHTATIFCGGSGTVARFLTAVLAFMPHGNYEITGISRLLERPIGDLVDALRQCGADIKYSNQDGYLPIRIGNFKNSIFKNKVNINCNPDATIMVNGSVSSQFLSGLLIGVNAVWRQPVKIQVTNELISKPYINMTIALLKMFGANITSILDMGDNKIICNNNNSNNKANDNNNNNDNNNHGNSSNQFLKSCTYTIEPDASSASYFMAMGSINHGDVIINHLSDNALQGDKNFAHILYLMGAQVDYLADSIRVCGVGKLNAIEVDMQDMPDVAMTLAVLALFANGTTVIHGISTWRVKETDRAYAMYTELTKLGATVTLESNTISITPPDKIIPNVAINTYNDHRIAMCFSLVALANVPVIINDYKCVAKTFANYFELLKNGLD